MRSGGKPGGPGTAYRQGGQGAAGTRGYTPSVTPCGPVFRDLRGVLRLSHADAAAVLQTRQDVILALETDQIAGLPPWPETARIVRDYAGLAGIDGGPLLEILRARMADYDPFAGDEVTTTGGRRAARGQPAHQPVHQRANGVAAFAGADAETEPGGSRLDRLWRMPAGISTAFSVLSWIGGLFASSAVRWGGAALIVALLLTMLVRTSSLHASVSTLPAPLSTWVMNLQDFLLAQVSERRDGHIWIDVADPRTRRGDKLPVRKR